jgi:hypothetical protein
MTERVMTTWDVEREHAERNYARYEVFTLDITGMFSYVPSCADDPGECRLELDSVTFRGTPFPLTAAEEDMLITSWCEELRNGD